ncbi:hypothetical protein T484DRAFT_3636482 [Baffinella frigidus]|nr:hypothetical protein T484DRAFT_3636482 [Cryptophyta sp. CCMP2293]
MQKDEEVEIKNRFIKAVKKTEPEVEVGVEEEKHLKRKPKKKIPIPVESKIESEEEEEVVVKRKSKPKKKKPVEKIICEDTSSEESEDDDTAIVNCFCGSRGSGKTWLSCKLVKSLYDKKVFEGDRIVPQRVILIFPSVHSPSNNIFEMLNVDWKKDVDEDYSDKMLDEIVEGLTQDQDDAKEYRQYVKSYIKFDAINNIDDVPIEQLMLSNSKDFIDPERIPKPKFPDGFYSIIILDDVLGTSALRQGRSRFTY